MIEGSGKGPRDRAGVEKIVPKGALRSLRRAARAAVLIPVNRVPAGNGRVLQVEPVVVPLVVPTSRPDTVLKSI